MQNELCAQITDLLSRQERVVVGICGYGGSGKSFVADKIAKQFGIEDGQILHMDYLHPKADNTNDEVEIFNDHDWPLIYKILQAARTQERLVYDTMGLWGHSHHIDTPMPKVLIIEGVRLLRSEIMPLLDIGVWIDCPVELATERAKARDRSTGQNEEHIAKWDNEWVPKNNRYVEQVHPEKLATFILEEYA